MQACLQRVEELTLAANVGRKVVVFNIFTVPKIYYFFNDVLKRGVGGEIKCLKIVMFFLIACPF